MTEANGGRPCKPNATIGVLFPRRPAENKIPKSLCSWSSSSTAFFYVKSWSRKREGCGTSQYCVSLIFPALPAAAPAGSNAERSGRRFHILRRTSGATWAPRKREQRGEMQARPVSRKQASSCHRTANPDRELPPPPPHTLDCE